jgi:hypothetical protein
LQRNLTKPVLRSLENRKIEERYTDKSSKELQRNLTKPVLRSLENRKIEERYTDKSSKELQRNLTKLKHDNLRCTYVIGDRLWHTVVLVLLPKWWRK